MKTEKLKTAAQLLIIVCIIAFVSCKKERTKYIKVKIDRIEITHDGASAHVDDSVSIRIYGTLEPCYEFDPYPLLYFNPSNENDVIIEAFGVKTNKENCHMIGKTLFDYEGKIVFEKPGVYTFHDILQPDVKLGEVEVR